MRSRPPPPARDTNLVGAGGGLPRGQIFAVPRREAPFDTEAWRPEPQGVQDFRPFRPEPLGDFEDRGPRPGDMDAHGEAF